MRITVDGLRVTFETAGGTVTALDDVSFVAEPGELVLLLGPSGSGKTTLLSCLAGILSPSAGSIVVGDQDVGSLDGREMTAYRRNTVGVVFQAFNLVASLSAIDNVAMPLRLAGAHRHPARARAAELLQRVDMDHRRRHLPAEMSGGQQQRVAIARALAHDPPVILADEPTAHLDRVQVQGVLALIRELARAGRTVVVSTHDDRLMPLADRVVELSSAMVVPGVSRRRELAAGDLVFAQGDASDVIYVVEHGEIELFRTRPGGADEAVGRVGPLGYFGELGPLLGFPRNASARATRPSVVIGYPVAEFRHAVRSDPRLAGLASPSAEFEPIELSLMERLLADGGRVLRGQGGVPAGWQVNAARRVARAAARRVISRARRPR